MKTVSAPAALLVTLLRQGEGYGLQLIRAIRAARLVFSNSVVYKALITLERRGLVMSRAAARSSEGGKPKIYYRLTAAGRSVAIDLVSTLRSLISWEPSELGPERRAEG